MDSFELRKELVGLAELVGRALTGVADEADMVFVMLKMSGDL